jgi:predicted Zn-dependent protease
MKRIFFCILLMITGLSSGCAVSKDDIRGFNIISLQEEKQLGARFVVEVEKQRKVVTDPQVQGYLDRLGNRLLTGVRAREFDFTFKAVRDDSVNAFAVPGGHVYVHTGLIKAAQNETELASVMAHEINHVVARHGTQQLTQQYGYGLVIQLILGQNPNLLAQLASTLFGQGAFMAYSRSMENQADYLGVETMYRAGYDPRGMISFFKKIDTINQRNPGALEQFFSSHPMTGERLRNVQIEISKLPPKTFREDSLEFNRIKAGI